MLHLLVYKNSPLLKYFGYSIVATIIDVAIVWILHNLFNIIIVGANTIGIFVGFIIHYLLASKSVFDSEYGTKGFFIYFVTFLFGLCLADILIYIGTYYLFTKFINNVNFLFSKGLSIVVPFFALYYLRKFLYEIVKSEESL